MASEVSIVIDRPIDEVFRLTIEDVPEWSIIVISDELIEEKPDGVGTTFRTVTEENGRQMEFAGVVTRHEPPHVHSIHLTGKMFDIDAGYTFEDLAGRTRVTQISDVTGKGVFKVFMFLFGWMMNKSHAEASRKEFESLKQYCEGHSSPTTE